MKSKGFFSHSLQIFIGLVVVVFTLMITSHFLGMWASFQYEQEAEKSTKNLQTAMNYVCASPQGATRTVEINLPQKISSRGAEANPISFLHSFITGDVEAVGKAMRYMTALESYGDPWYTIYYEKFPEGEDTGWTGWSEVAAMRTTSMVWRSAEVATCLVPFHRLAGALKWVGKAGAGGGSYVVRKTAKKAGKLAGRNFEDAIRKSRAAKKAGAAVTKIILAGQKSRKIGRKLFLKDVWPKISTKVKSSANNLWRWIRYGHSSAQFRDHFDEYAKSHQIATLIDVDVEDISKFSKIEIHSDDFYNKIDDFMDGRMTHGEAQSFMKDIKYLSDPDASKADRIIKLNKLGIDGNEYYEAAEEAGKGLENYAYTGFDQGLINKKDKDIVFDITQRLKNGDNTINLDEIRNVKRILKKAGWTAEDIENDDYIISLEAYTEMHRMGSHLKPSKLFGDENPLRWTQAIYHSQIDNTKISSLPHLAMFASKKVLKHAHKKHIVGRWGTWYGSSFVFSNALDRMQISQMKFSPCMDHSLCLKSQANPSIGIYPLEECKQAGIDYIELNKYAVESSKAGVSFNRNEPKVVVKDSKLPKKLYPESSTILNLQGRRELSCTGTSQNKIYCFGGIKGTEYIADTYFDQIFSYDPAYYYVNDELVANLTPAIKGLSCVESSLNNNIYCFGGMNKTGGYQSEILKYDVEKDEINTIPGPLGESLKISPREGLSCVESSENGLIYCFGGKRSNVYLDNYLDDIIKFDPSANTASCMDATLLTKTAYSSCVESSLNHKIYCFGGKNNSGLSKKIIEFDPSADTSSSMLTTLSTKLPAKIAYSSCAESSLNKKIYCFGGESSSDDYLDDIVEFDPRDNSTEKNSDVIGELPFTIKSLSCVESLEGKIYCFGGKKNSGDSKDIIEYTPPTPKVVEIPNMVRFIDKLLSSSAYTRFYSASPCGGKMNITKTECNCVLDKDPFIDETSINTYIFECEVKDVENDDEAECNITLYRDYGENIDLIKEEENLGSENINIEDKKPDPTTVKYQINLSFTNYIKNRPEYEMFRTNFSKECDAFFKAQNLNCTRYISEDTSKFTCADSSVPSVPFYTSDCVRGDQWLKCSDWEKIDEGKQKQFGFKGSTEIETEEWCCTKWKIGNNETNSNEGDLISEIDLKVKSESACSHPRENITEGLNKAYPEDEDDDYVNHIKEGVIKTIKEGSIQTLPAKVDLSSDANENGELSNETEYGKPYWTKLDTKTTTDCLKVRYVSEPETEGFCYTPPPNHERLKEAGIAAGSIIAELGITGICGVYTAGLGLAACSGFACEIGNMVMWYGQNKIADEKLKRLWPNNPYFGNYFIE